MAGTKKTLNPILKKELRLGSRSIKMPLFVMGYDIVLTLLAVICLFSIGLSGGNGSVDFSNYLYIYQIIGWTQLAITLIIVPILTAGTISGERERQTLDIMLTTPKKPISIVWGKLLSALSNYFIFIISSIPIMAIAFILGGLNWFALLGYVAMLMVVAIYIGSVGVFCSSVFKRTIASIVMTFVIAGALLIVPYVLFLMILGGAEIIYEAVYDSYIYSSTTTTVVPDLNLGILPMLMIFNPLSGFFDYMMQTMDIVSIHQIIDDADVFGVIMPIISYAWIPMNVIACGAVSYFFIHQAGNKLNPLKRRRKKKSKKAVTAAAVVNPNAELNYTQPAPQLYQPTQVQPGMQAQTQQAAVQGMQVQETATQDVQVQETAVQGMQMQETTMQDVQLQEMATQDVQIQETATQDVQDVQGKEESVQVAETTEKLVGGTNVR